MRWGIGGRPQSTRGAAGSLAEAMAAGRPVIACKGPGQEAIVEHGENGFLIDFPQEMVDHIVTFSRNKNLQKLMQENARKTAQRYRPSECVKNLVSFYEKISKKNL